MYMYIGIYECECYPLPLAVLVTANNDSEAKNKYEDYLRKNNGYIMNLYPLDDGDDYNRKVYAPIINDPRTPII